MLDYTLSTEQLAELRAAYWGLDHNLIPPTLFSPGVATPLQNMVLRV